MHNALQVLRLCWIHSLQVLEELAYVEGATQANWQHSLPILEKL